MAHSVEYILNITAKNTGFIDKIGGKVHHLNKTTNAANAALKKLGGVAVAYFGINKVVNYVNQSVQAYERQMVAETKLRTVMRNTMNATDDQIKSIKELAGAQQKLGVIGGGIQLAGAQELGTYLTKTESLKKLIPVMNDMLAQQYGINATQEQAVQIGSMMGKVMDGQVGALSRYGYKFTEAQEKILKYGTEQQRVTTLAQVITGSVGGMNAALAATPEGKLKQAANRMSDIQARVGGMWVAVKSAWLPVSEFFGDLMNRLVNWFEANREKILGVVGKIAQGVVSGLSMVINIATGVSRVIYNIITAVQSAAGIIIPILSTIGAYFVIAHANFALFTVKYYAYIAATKLGAIFTGAWAAAQMILNTAIKAFTAHPIIAALTAVIGLVVVGISVFRKFNAQKSIVEKTTGNLAAKIGVEQRALNGLFDAIKKTNPGSERRKTLINEINDKYPGLLKNINLEKAGLEDIAKAQRDANQELARNIGLQEFRSQQEKAMKEIQSAEQKVWDKLFQRGYSENDINEFIDEIHEAAKKSNLNGVERDKARYELVIKGKSLSERRAISDLFEKSNVYSHALSAIENFLSGRYGIAPAVLHAAGASGNSTNGGGTDITRTTESIVTGGTKSTNITITIGNLVEKMTFTAADMKQNVKDMRDQVLDELLRVVNMSQSAAM